MLRAKATGLRPQFPVLYTDASEEAPEDGGRWLGAAASGAAAWSSGGPFDTTTHYPPDVGDWRVHEDTGWP